MYRTQVNMDERTVVFFYPEKVFLYPFTWAKNCCFLITNFLWEKIAKNINVTIYSDMGVTFCQSTKKIPELVSEIQTTSANCIPVKRINRIRLYRIRF